MRGLGMDPLARLFSSSARLKLLRLFLFNDDSAYSVTNAAFRINVPKDSVRKEMRVLLTAGIIKKRPAGKELNAYGANKRFLHYQPLQAFLRTTTNLDDVSIITSLKKSGNLRLVVLSGLFTGAVETKVDLLVVGDKLEDRQLEKSVHELEAELGRELRYASFSLQDYKYRLGVYDRLIRDIFDFPHRTIFDKTGF